MNTIQDVFNASFHEYKNKNFVSNVQSKAAFSIMNCKTNKMGFNKSTCQNCNHEEIHYNSCKNRNCPNCQIIQKDIWIDSRKAELVDTPYFHVVFTIPDELN
ncbi:MAG TPA: transposase zinc-binding domain-containing protein, partial [Thomasclavelia ramosa]|nr:transposase zinc-binding domain-containing protein [Thomasclavelia ramosa]